MGIKKSEMAMRIITFATILFVCAMAVASNTHDHNGEVDSGKEVWESSSITGVADGDENDKVVFVNTPDSDEESLESQLLESSRRRRRSSKKKKSTKGEPCPEKKYSWRPGYKSTVIGACEKRCNEDCTDAGQSNCGSRCSTCCANKNQGEEATEETLLRLLGSSTASTEGWNTC